METKLDYEAQLVAMRAVMEALSSLDQADREAVLTWVTTQLGIKKNIVSLDQTRFSAEESSNEGVSVKRQGTVSVVAQRMQVKSARDLLLAAATHLTLYQGKDSFTKDELIACAKEARSWKATYSNQMASNIKRMSDAGDLFEKARDIFSLSDEALTDIEAKLAK